MENNLLKDYFETTNNIVKRSFELSQDDINELAVKVSEDMIKDGVIQLFGVGHDLALSMELGFRAGGLVQYHIMDMRDLPLRGVISTEETLAEDYLKRDDLAEKLMAMYNVEANDAFLLYVSTEVHQVTLDLAKLAKANGHNVYLITNKSAVEATNIKNAQELFAIVDHIIDLHIAYPDQIFSLDNLQVSQVSNLVANMFAQSLTMEIYKYMKSKNYEPAVLWSMNIEGADQHNKNLTSKYDGRWNS